jgi:hypothetical protein
VLIERKKKKELALVVELSANFRFFVNRFLSLIELVSFRFKHRIPMVTVETGKISPVMEQTHTAILFLAEPTDWFAIVTCNCSVGISHPQFLPMLHLLASAHNVL